MLMWILSSLFLFGFFSFEVHWCLHLWRVGHAPLCPLGLIKPYERVPLLQPICCLLDVFHFPYFALGPLAQCLKVMFFRLSRRYISNPHGSRPAETLFLLPSPYFLLLLSFVLSYLWNLWSQHASLPFPDYHGCSEDGFLQRLHFRQFLWLML